MLSSILKASFNSLHVCLVNVKLKLKQDAFATATQQEMIAFMILVGLGHDSVESISHPLSESNSSSLICDIIKEHHNKNGITIANRKQSENIKLLQYFIGFGRRCHPVGVSKFLQ